MGARENKAGMTESHAAEGLLTGKGQQKGEKIEMEVRSIQEKWAIQFADPVKGKMMLTVQSIYMTPYACRKLHNKDEARTGDL